MSNDQKNDVVVLGGGCFWCTEAIFRMVKGVVSVLPGYAGGVKLNPTYKDVCDGETGHAEVIRIEYNNQGVAFRDLLTVFFATHDPTTVNRQGADVGTQYRSVIFYTLESQKEEAELFIKEINDSHDGGNTVVTEVKPLDVFYLAEESHQDYYQKNHPVIRQDAMSDDMADTSYCQIVINPKLKSVQEKFSKLIK